MANNLSVESKLIRYIIDDDAYERHTFQVLGARAKKGYAERAIIETTLDLIDSSETCQANDLIARFTSERSVKMHYTAS